MIYYYSNRFSELWEDISYMIDDNYAHEYEHNTCLVMSANLLFGIADGKNEIPNHEKTIVYQLEPLIKEHWFDMERMINCLKKYDEVWDYDLDNIKVLNEYGIDAKFKPFVYSENLKRIENKKDPDIDILFYGTRTEYRDKILFDLTRLYLPYDLNVVTLSNVTGKLLDDFISKSKIILDLSNNGPSYSRFQKQSRIYYALINNKCVISERSQRNYFGDLITEFDYDEELNNLTDIIKDYLYNEKWKNYLNVSEKFKDLTEKNKEKNIIKINKNMDKNYIIKKISEIETSWTDHINFAQWIVEKKKPDVIVDLRVDYAYSTFCFALPEIGHVYGIDSFEGDERAGTRNTYDVVNEIKNQLNFNNITFIKGYFDDIAKDWDKKIDILHIDGFHSYEAVKNDYDTWSKFVKDDGIILFHDTCVNNPNFGVKRFFDELDLPKVNFTCSYGLGVVSKNKELIQEIDMVFDITPKNKIGIFYHLFQTDDYEWVRLYYQQINSLIVSGLYDVCDFIHIGINGDKELPFVLDKMKVQYNEDKILEADTLHSLWKFCRKNEDYKVLYFHSKGVTHKNNDCKINVDAWRLYLEYFVIHNWKTCIEDLDKYDCASVEWVDRNSLNNINDKLFVEHFSGNFWWSTANYITKLEPNYLYEKISVITNEDVDSDRYRSEFWIGTQNPNYKSYHNSNKILYCDYYSPNYYIKFHREKITEDTTMKNNSKTNTKIVMISMFKNESKGIRRMLESCYQYIDYWILQDNGSTDGTPDIVREFFADKNIPGFIYEVEEGWVGFGWNRDHLLQTCLKTDHGCDWIMKMDCDEYLEVDDDFDWSPFKDTSIDSFHVTAETLGCIYYRAWIWNAKLPWKFKHDVAHECIYLDNEIEENFERFNLPRGLRMIGTDDGESYTVPTKYISDALKLEEQMIREGTMLTDLYHFWYIAKSYMDCYAADFYPLQDRHSKEFVRRMIFYFEEYLKYVNMQGIHEMSYFAAFSIGLGYRYLKEYEKAIWWFNNSEKYCPVRNEHIVYLAETYGELGQYENMFEQSSRLLQPDRKLPFPDYYFLLDNTIYYDSGPVPQQLYQYSLKKRLENQNQDINSFSINIKTKPRLWIVDDFYHDPYKVREFALKQEFKSDDNWYKGNRTEKQFIIPGTKEAFERILGKKITGWTESHGMCGRFQYCTAQDDLVYHCDDQTFAGMVYLTPNAPFSCGTSFFSHKKTGLRNENDFGNVDIFSETGYYDRSKFELVDTAGNVFNRLVLFDSKCIHSANEYFGTDITNSRLFHLFFFDCNEI